MANFDYSNFDKIYETKIYPELAPLEEERKKLIIQCAVAIVIVLVLSCILVYLSQYVEKITKVASIPWALAIFYVIARVNNYKQTIKDKFYQKLFNSLGFQYSSGSSSESMITHICRESDIFNRYDFVESDDKITGEYKDLPFTALDTYIYYETTDSKGRKTQHTIFRGILLSTRINKPLKCDILIKEDKLFKAGSIKDKKVVRLEDPEFEKYFEVYATDQIESRYILTTAFMNRLLNYRKMKKRPVEVVLNNNITTDNVFFFVKTNKDNFEVPIFHSILDKQIFLNILKELTDALDVINELKLEQNIGL